jgi:hypothetical protein
MMGDECPGGMEIFQARLLVEICVGATELSATPEPFGPRKRRQEGSAEIALRVVRRRERNAGRIAVMDVIRGNTETEITVFPEEVEDLAAVLVKLYFVAFEVFDDGAAAEVGFGRLGKDGCLEFAELVEGVGEGWD